MSTQSSGHERTSSVSSSSIHYNILKESKESVFDKYDILEVLGQGSMGFVARVKVKSGKVGGSATEPKTKKGPLVGLGLAFRRKAIKNPKEIQETSDHVYALKSIQVSRINPVFLEEMENEVRTLVLVKYCLCLNLR